MQIVSVFFSYFLLISASSNTNESGSSKILNRERSQTESQVTTAKSSNIPITKADSRNLDNASYSFNERIIFSPKQFDEEKSPIAKPDFLKYLKNDKPSSSSKVKLIQKSSATSDDEGSSSEEEEEEKRKSGNEEELMFEMDDIEH